MADSELLFGDDAAVSEETAFVRPAKIEQFWKVAIVDDDEDMHSVTLMALRKLEFLGRKLQFQHAYSGAEAKALMLENPDITVVILDVVMEQEDSGLQIVRYIREQLGNSTVRILLRTGQPGMAPEKSIIVDYDINDYMEKQEVTARRLHTSIIASLRTYELHRKMLHHSMELERANQAKTIFLANMSHQMRTPLHGILSFAKMGISRLDKLPQEKILQYFTNIEVSGSRLLRIMNALLDITSIESGLTQLQPDKVDLRWIISSALAEYNNKIQMKHIVIEQHISDTMLLLEVDQNKIAQVVENILANAIHFSPDKGTITITANTVTHKLDSAEIVPAVSLKIADSGKGFPAGEEESIFHKFAHASDIKTGTAGCGLGLTICKELVAMHHGSISAANQPGGGAVLEVVLPLHFVSKTDKQ